MNGFETLPGYATLTSSLRNIFVRTSFRGSQSPHNRLRTAELTTPIYKLDAVTLLEKIMYVV